MSASDWSICPKCFAEAKQEIEQRKEQLRESYGNIPADVWAEKRKQIPDQPNPQKYMTLREDYEFIMNEDGSFEAYYGAQCTECDASFDFNHNQKEAIQL